MERHFECTACGKCCFGQLPLTIEDALAHADKFPLIMVWTPLAQGARSYNVTAEIGITVHISKRRNVAVRVSPSAYIPPTFPCPELTDDGLCGIHERKPQRCRTMPFSAYRDETDQDDLMIPRSGWTCDTTNEAPIVYKDRSIVSRKAFETEREGLLRDATILKPYAEWLLDSSPPLRKELHKIAMKPKGGQVLISFSTLVSRLPNVGIYAFAKQQLPVMADFAARTADDRSLAEFHQRYINCAEEWRKVFR